MRYILGLLGFIFLIILVIILFARMGNRGRTELDLDPLPQLVEAASSDADFVFTEQGPIVAEENHYQIRISIDRISRRVEVIRGYQNSVVAQQNFDNNEQAFEQFLSALDRNGYSNEAKSEFDSEEGLCSQGRRYIFESNQFSERFRRWSTSCSKIRGNFGGAIERVRQLFRDQIPEYSKFISDTRRETGLKLR